MNKRIVGLILISAVLLTGCSAAQAQETNPSLLQAESILSAMDTKTSDSIGQEEKTVLRAEIFEAKQEQKRQLEAARQAEEARIAAEAKAKADEEARVAEEERIAQEKAAQAKAEVARKDAASVKPNAPVAVPNIPAIPAEPVKVASSTGLMAGESGFDWINRMQRQYGVYAYPGTEFSIKGSTNCHSFALQALGCTTQEVDAETRKPTHKRISVALTPSSIGNPYVLFHEIAHTQGIMDDCQADIFSRNITGIPGGYYC